MTRRRRLLFNANDYCIRNRTIFLSGYDKGEAERGGEGRAGERGAGSASESPHYATVDGEQYTLVL